MVSGPGAPADRPACTRKGFRDAGRGHRPAVLVLVARTRGAQQIGAAVSSAWAEAQLAELAERPCRRCGSGDVPHRVGEAVDLVLGVEIVDRGPRERSEAPAPQVQSGKGQGRDRDVDTLLPQRLGDGLR